MIDVLDAVTINGKTASCVAQETSEHLCRQANRLDLLDTVAGSLGAILRSRSDFWDDVDGNSVPYVESDIRLNANSILARVIRGENEPLEAPEIPEIPLKPETLVSGIRADEAVKRAASNAVGNREGRKELVEDVSQDLWGFVAENPSLWNPEKIRASHEKANRNPDDPTRNYGAARYLKLEAEKLTRQKEHEAKGFTVLPIEKDELEKTLRDWPDKGLPEPVQAAIASDRLPESWRTPLEEHYLKGKTATDVGRQALSRAKERLAEVIPSFQKDSERQVVTEEPLDPLLEVGTQDASPLDRLEYQAQQAQPYESLGPVSKFRSCFRGMSKKTANQNLLGAGGLRDDLKAFDVEPSLYLWANGVNASQKLLEGLEGLSEDDRTLLHIRYDNSRDVRSKRIYHEQSVDALNRLRGIMRVRAGKGMAD